MDINKLLIFDVYGSMAHFRKFYTNSSSLSYMFPPRTTVIGLIAAMLGRERDTYYEEFSSDNCRIAVSVRTRLRKLMQTVNYLQTKGTGGLNGSKGHTQIPLEILLPEKNMIVYRIYFSHDDARLMDELSERIKRGRFFYPVYLGLSEFIASARFVDEITGGDIDVKPPGGSYDICSVLNSNMLVDRGLNFVDSGGGPLQYIKELMPAEFDKDRNVKSTANFIYEKNSNIISGKFNVPVYNLKYDGLEENIVFMEE